MAWSAKFLYRDCPWCGVKLVAMEKRTEATRLTSADGTLREWTWVSCPKCASAVSIETTPAYQQVVRVVPEHRTEVDVDHLPDDVRAYYRNAVTVLEAGVPSSAAVELRKTLEAAAHHKGIDERILVNAIKKLVEQGFMTNDFSGVLGHIRKIGNSGAHASDEELTAEEVQVALKFTTQVLRNLFEIPRELELLSVAVKPEEEVAA